LPQKYFSFSFTPGFSQVTTFRFFDWKPFKRFPLDFQFRDTWLKPGVNERDSALYNAMQESRTEVYATIATRRRGKSIV
jgi:hypothetical protein